MHTCEAIERHAREQPSKTAVIDEKGGIYSWFEFQNRVEAVAALLARVGSSAGDRVALLSENSARLIEATFGIQWLGAVAVPINTRWTITEVEVALTDCTPKVLIIDETHGERLEQSTAEPLRDLVILRLNETGRFPEGAISYDDPVS